MLRKARNMHSFQLISYMDKRVFLVALVIIGLVDVERLNNHGEASGDVKLPAVKQ